MFYDNLSLSFSPFPPLPFPLMSSPHLRPSNSAVSGGNILRGGRAPPSASPYLRPEAPPRPLEDQPRRGATWMSSVVAGAGRLISYVFKSDSPSSSHSCSYSTEEDSATNFGGDEDVDVTFKECDVPKQRERMSEPVKDCNGASVAIISEVEPKQAIEQLLMQETFSRDEGEELIKLVESRVVEVVKDEMHKEPDRTTDNVVASLRTWKYLNLSRKLPEAVSNPSGNLNANSPGYPAFQVPETELHNSAVIKAKKWLEDKKVASSSRVDFDCRACTFDTNMLQKDFGGEEGSPVDLAKSYMQSVSPWRSSLRSIRFEKTPCTGMHLYNDEAPSTTPNYSMSSSKGLKRDHPSCGLHDLVDESRRVRLKSTDGASDNSSFKLINSSERNSKDEACITSYAAEKHIHHNSNNEGPVDEVQLMRETPLSGTSPSVVIAEQATIGNASLASLLSRGRSSVGIGPAFPHSEEKQDVEEHCQVKVQLDSLSGPCTTPTLAPTTKEHAGLMEQDRIDTIQDGAVQKQEKKDQIQDESNRLRISADGPSAGLSTGINVALEEDRSAANFSNEEGTFELPSTYNTKVPAAKTTKSKTRASSGSRGRAKMKSVKDPLWKPEPSVSRGRGRKSVPGARRGRGV